MSEYYFSRFDLSRLGPASMTLSETGGSTYLISFTGTTSDRFYHGDGTSNTTDGKPTADGGTDCFGVRLALLLNTAGADNTYAVSFATATGLYTVSRATGARTFSLTFSTLGAAGRRMRQILGHDADTSAGTSQVSDRSPHYWLAGSPKSDDSGRQPRTENGRGVVRISGGTPYGVGPARIAYGRRWTGRFHSQAAAYNSQDTTADGDVWTWERFLEHHRKGARWLHFPHGTTTFTYAYREAVYLLSQAGIDEWAVERVIPNSNAYWDVGIDAIEVAAGDPSAASPYLLDESADTFSRASVATYRTSAHTIQHAAVDELRYEDVGDGTGPHALYEGTATNINTESEDIDSGSAWGQEYLTGTDGYMAAPDGSIEGDRLVSSASGAGYNREFLYALIGASSTYTFSVWYRDGTVNTGAHDYSIGISVRESVGSTLVYTTVDIPPTGSWTRASVTKTGEGTTEGYSMLYVNDNGQSGPRAAVGDDVVYYGAQLELGRFPTSYIVSTSGSSTARSADTRTWADSHATMRTGRWQVDLWPEYGSSDLVSGDIFVAFSFVDANNSLRVRHDGTGVRVEAYAGSAVKAASDYLTFSRDQRLVVTVDCVAATIAVTGATTGDGTGSAGTAWTWASGTLRVGGNVSGTAEFYGGIGLPRAA